MKNPYKNKIHLEPPKGLMNDPNGVSYFQGKYYVFHQWNRFACDHSYKEWGLFTSHNLIDWHHEGSAILPDSQQDAQGVYSGSAVAVEDKLRIFYTGNTKNNTVRKSYQIMAVSQDGKTYLKTNRFETPDELSEHHRDPKVYFFRNQWQMLVGSQTKKGKGAVALYTSSDLEDWQYQGIFFEAEELDQMCECPDLLDFGNQQVLLVCPQKRDLENDSDISSYSAYYLGQVDNNRFLPQTELSLVDHGFDFYAPQTVKDHKGRYLMWAWMSRMSDKEEKSCPTQEFGYLHCLTMPRELVLEGGKLYQRPLEEFIETRKVLEQSHSTKMAFVQTDETLLLEINFNEKVKDFQLSLADGQVELSYSDNQFKLRRLNWLDDLFQEKELKLEELQELQIFLDQSAIEIFINKGEFVMSLRYFPKDLIKKHRFTCDKGHQSTLSKLEIGEENG